MKLSSYLNPKCIYLNLEGCSKEDIIGQMINNTAKNDEIFNESVDLIRKSIFAREAEVSTAMGSSIAIPHARVDGYDDILISIGIVKEPIECEMADMRNKDQVKIFFMITAETLKSKVILKIMSSITKIAVKDKVLLEKLKNAKTGSEVYDLLSHIDVKIENKIIAEDVMDPTIKPVSPNDTLDNIARRLIREEKSGFPVVDTDGTFLGEMTERELILFGMPKYTLVMDDLDFLTVGEPFEEYLKNEKITRIKDIYRKTTTIVDRKTPIMEICFLMENKGFTRIYVVENGKYYGTILRSHIIKKVLHI
ncbi:PTS sugar transporter subunit IIA [Psychrilyobacter atlanticus]|uniref:PTS sugar transporter subunit IIA n=1 Tax=Psychrilyobacter atlanticus TaxID=271091 RepID=UPI0003F542EE|nr:PTS sugar transporter subunit IIA [Psychrilyobacter atlanticus]